MCEKIRFHNKARVKQYLARSRGLKRDGLHAYFCAECGFWHFGHRVKGYYQRGA